MKSKQRAVAIVLLLLLGAAIFALVRTRDAINTQASKSSAAAEQAPLVDQTPMLTAQQFAKMPTSAEEKPFAEEALHLGDQEMDLAFAAAVRDAQMHPPVLSPKAKEIQAHLRKAEDALDADKKRVDQLTADDAKATGSRKDALDDQLDVAKAQLELDQDEADESKQDLLRAGGDPQGRIQSMVEEHEAASHSSDATKVTVTAPVESRGLIHLFQQWSELHRKQLQLWRAKQDAETSAAAFSAKHAALETQVSAVVAQPSSPAAPAKNAKASPSREESAAMAKTTRLRANDQKTLTSLDKRIDDQQQLAGVYAGWISVVSAKQRSVLHQAILGITIVLAILLIGVFFDGWLERLLGKTSLDRRQVETLRTVTRVTLQILAVPLHPARDLSVRPIKSARSSD